MPPGSYTSAAIVLLTDGQRTTGPDPVEAAKMSADRGIKIFTVGIGTTDGEIMGFEGWRMRVRLDEETLKTHRQYDARGILLRGHRGGAEQIYRSMNSRFVMEKKETEITALVSAVAAVLAVARRAAFARLVQSHSLIRTAPIRTHVRVCEGSGRTGVSDTQPDTLLFRRETRNGCARYIFPDLDV